MAFKRGINLNFLLSALITVVLFAVAFLLHTSLYIDLSISTATPMLFLPLITSICIFSSFWSGVSAGLVAGILLDGVSNGFYCFNAIMFLVIAVAVWLFANNLFNKNISAALTLSLISALFYKVFWWLLNYFPSLEFKESFSLLFEYAVPSAVYSCVFTIPFFYIYKWLYKIKSN